MNSKIFWGLVIVVLSLFNVIDEKIRNYIFNYQMAMILVGIYTLTKKRKYGWIFLCVGIYLYLTEYVWPELSIFIKNIPLILGLVIIGFGIKEIVDKKKLTKFSSKDIKESKNEEIVDAEEVKK